MAKKPYSLDFTLERDTERTQFIADTLDRLEKDPSPTELEQMATYILYGKDENGLSSIRRGETYNNNKRYNSYKTLDDKVVSYDELMESPGSDEQAFRDAYTRDVYKKQKPAISRPKYDKKTGELIDIGDADIPGMVELWERLDHYEKWLRILQGKEPPDENFLIFEDDYRLYRLKHNLIDMRRQQYYLKDAYKPEIHFQKLDHPKAQFYDWDGQSAYWIPYDKWEYRVTHSYTHTVSRNIADYEVRETPNGKEVKWVVCEHNFDWTNYKHVRALINQYQNLKEALNEKLDTYGRTLIWDLERYIEMTNFPPLRMAVLQGRLDQKPCEQICADLEHDFGVTYSTYYLSSLISNEIPKTIATTALRWKLLVETPKDQLKVCNKCGRALPRHPLFYTKNNGRKDGLQSSCRECERQRRINRGEQDELDRRKKDSSLSQV